MARKDDSLFTDAQLMDEFRYYLDNMNDIVREFGGKYIVIKERKVIGAYKDALEAFNETSKIHEPGTFLVQLASTDKSAYSSTYHSRVNV